MPAVSTRNALANKQGDVRFGLAAIKGVGEAAVESIIAERTKNGRFKDIYDFIERVDYSLVNRKCNGCPGSFMLLREPMAMPLGRRKPTLLEDLMLLRILWYFSQFLVFLHKRRSGKRARDAPCRIVMD